MTRKTFVVACGGTGGHVFPGLVVANELKRRGHAVEVWFSGRTIEATTHSYWNGAVFSTGARQLSLRNFPQLARAFYRSAHALSRLQPDALLAMGSYASLPPVVAAWLRKTPVLLHEANAVPGKAVDFLSGIATLTALSFQETAEWMPKRKTIFTGLPIRSELDGQSRFEEVSEGLFTIFVTGGSQGARRVNRLVSQAMCLLKQSGVDDFYVIHQCGSADEAHVRETYASAGVRAKVCAFINEMGRAYASADLVICRAGASTCFELCAVGKPALLIPLPSALRNHQHLNALALTKSGGTDLAVEQELSARSIMRYVLNRKNNPTTLQHMAQAVRSLAQPDAVVRVADALEKLTENP